MPELPEFLRPQPRRQMSRLDLALEALQECEHATRDCAALVLELVPPEDDIAAECRRLIKALDG